MESFTFTFLSPGTATDAQAVFYVSYTGPKTVGARQLNPTAVRGLSVVHKVALVHIY